METLGSRKLILINKVLKFKVNFQGKEGATPPLLITLLTTSKQRL